MTNALNYEVLNTYSPTELETASGKTIDFENPRPSQIDISDIAFGLSRIPRFSGQTQTKFAYNVALHSIWVSEYLYRKTESYQLALLGLLHDAHEAYCGDIPTPLKNSYGLKAALWEMEQRFYSVICRALGVTPANTDQKIQVGIADKQALIVEAEHLKISRGLGWGLPEKDQLADRVTFYGPCVALASHELFLRRFWSLLEMANTEKVKH